MGVAFYLGVTNTFGDETEVLVYNMVNVLSATE